MKLPHEMLCSTERTPPNSVKTDDREAGISIKRTRYAPGAQIDSGDSNGLTTARILSGWAAEQRLLLNGERQIFTFLIPGDAVVLSPECNLGDRAVTALTPSVLEQDTVEKDLVAAVNRISALREKRLLDHVVRLGSLNACERATHLLLELHDRLMAVGLVEGRSFLLPVTQETFGEALGLSMVHVNRTFQQLRRRGLIASRGGVVTLLKPKALSDLCGYTSVQDSVVEGD